MRHWNPSLSSTTPRLSYRYFGWIGFALLAAIAGCNNTPPATALPPAEVIAAVPVKAPIVDWDEYVGRLEAIDSVEVRARVSGSLELIKFEEGQIVSEGDLLCVIDQRPFQAEVRRTESDIAKAESQVEQAKAAVLQAEAEVQVAQSRYDLADKQVKRSERLLSQSALSQDEYDVRESELRQARANLDAVKARVVLSKTNVASAEAEVEAAKALLAVARLNLEYTEIRAPITGRISSRLITEGNLITGGAAQSTLITTIVSLDPIHCYFDADEQSFLKYQRLTSNGTLASMRDAKPPVYVGLADEPNAFPHRGYMDFVDNRLDAQTATMRGRAILPNKDLLLTPGSFTRVRLPGSGRYDAVLVPDLAISTDQSEKFVFVINKDNTVRRQVVELGPIARGLRVIRSGLDGSEQIIVRGLQRVTPGAPVTASVEAIAMKDDGLPDDNQPVPKDQWLSRQPRLGRPDQLDTAEERTILPAAMNEPIVDSSQGVN